MSKPETPCLDVEALAPQCLISDPPPTHRYYGRELTYETLSMILIRERLPSLGFRRYTYAAPCCSELWPYLVYSADYDRPVPLPLLRLNIALPPWGSSHMV